MAYEGNRYAGLNRKGPDDKAGWLGAAGTVAGAGLGLLAGPGGMAAGAKLGGALGGVTHDAVNGTLTPQSAMGDVAQGVAGFNGLNTAMDTRSIIEEFMRNPHQFRVGFANGGLVTGPAMDMASQWAQMDPVQRAMLQAQQAVGPAPVAPVPAQTQQAQHPTLEALSSLLPQIMAAMPRPANPKNTKAIGAWLPAAGLALSAPAAVAQSRRASANAPIEAANTAARSDYEAKRKAYEDRLTRFGEQAMENMKPSGGGGSSDRFSTPIPEEVRSGLGLPGWVETYGQLDELTKTKRETRLGTPKIAAVKQGPAMLSRAALLASARRYIQTGVIDVSARDTVNRAAVQNVAAELRNGGTGDISLNKAEYDADSKSLKDLRGATDALTAFEGTALRNASQLRQRMSLISDSGSPLFNQLIRDVQATALGPAELAAFNAARRVVIPEFSRILNNPKLTGQLTDTMRQDMEDILKGNATVAQVLEVLDVLQTDARNRRSENEAQIQEITRRIRERGGPMSDVEAPLPSTPSVSAPAVDPSQFVRRGQTPKVRG